MERLIVKQLIYPPLLTPPPSLVFDDQFAFRPTGSTTAAVIAILQTVTNSHFRFIIVELVDSENIENDTNIMFLSLFNVKFVTQSGSLPQNLCPPSWILVTCLILDVGRNQH